MRHGSLSETTGKFVNLDAPQKENIEGYKENIKTVSVSFLTTQLNTINQRYIYILYPVLNIVYIVVSILMVINGRCFRRLCESFSPEPSQLLKSKGLGLLCTLHCLGFSSKQYRLRSNLERPTKLSNDHKPLRTYPATVLAL